MCAEWLQVEWEAPYREPGFGMRASQTGAWLSWSHGAASGKSFSFLGHTDQL